MTAAALVSAFNVALCQGADSRKRVSERLSRPSQRQRKRWKPFFDRSPAASGLYASARGPQVERHRHGTWVTGEVAVAALLITPAFIGAADVRDAPAKPMRRPSEPPQQSFALSPLVVGLPVRGAFWIGVCKFDYSS
jgi:hypothetical protein